MSIRSLIGSVLVPLRVARNLVEYRLNRRVRKSGLPRPENIGRSQNGRALEVFTFGTGERHVLLLFGIHGNEVGTVKLAYQVMRWLRREESLIAAYTVHCVPCVNPDGYDLARIHPDWMHGGRIGRYNARGVDLNRNFPTASFASQNVWRHGRHYQNQTTVFCGAHPTSESETQSIIRHIKALQPTLICSFHNAGADVIASQTSLAPSLAQHYARVARYRYMQDDEWQQLGQTGTLKEWSEEQGMHCLEIECSRRYTSDWRKSKRALSMLFRQTLG